LGVGSRIEETISSLVMNSSEVNSKFKFSDKERDVETRLYYFGTMNYDIHIQRG